MTRYAIVFLAAAGLALAGCQSATSKAPSGTAAAPAAATPKQIVALSNQTTVWECPQCGADYDGPGACTMDGTALVETHVSYICPADGQPVDHAGKCPRCAANARVEKQAVAASVPPVEEEGN